MSLLASTRRSSPQPSPSLPPSPDEEDLGWRTPWSYSDDSLDRQAVTTTEPSQYSKGKEKATEGQLHPSASYASSGADKGFRSLDQGRDTEAYPPTTDEEAEARRVQENLRRWEVAERQRWKTARESFVASTSSSVIADVARRATSFWSRRASHPPADSGGRHIALQTSEDNVHLDEMATSPSPSAPPSPSPTPAPDHPRTGLYSHPRDPFSDRPGSSSSLFVNAQPMDADIGAPATAEERQAPASAMSLPPSRHMNASTPKHAATRRGKVVGAPAPLDLPEPRSPPPRTATPHATRPPEPFPRPDSRVSNTTVCNDEDEKPVRWWTEWLCGCSEGQDRGGEAQAGRTNPLE
ncbi:hypothetical protein BJV78DRAFT_1278684 [Lactifluus subvellereus]|nr:hypothetical protein BJV78DRAFT_1278684 [Lactifluus subvellereus]